MPGIEALLQASCATTGTETAKARRNTDRTGKYFCEPLKTHMATPQKLRQKIFLKTFLQNVTFYPSQCHMYSARENTLDTTNERSNTMQLQTSSTPLLTAAKLTELAALGRNRISQLYLHWSDVYKRQVMASCTTTTTSISTPTAAFTKPARSSPSLKAIRGNATPARSVSLCAADWARCPTTAPILNLAVTRPHRSK